MTELKITVQSFPMLDTGLGKEAGFDSDADLLASAKAERDGWSAEMRAAADAFDAELHRHLLFGS